jgi:hypothetical protein
MLAAQSFDLSEEAGADVALQLPWALTLAWATTVVAIILVILAVVFALFRASSAGQAFGVGVVLVLVGASMAFVTWRGVRTIQHAPNWLAVSEDSLDYGRRDCGRTMHVKWTAPRLALTLRDRRQIHSRLGTKDRRAVYSVIINQRVRIPLSKAAYDAILSRAEQRGLSVRNRVFLEVSVTEVRPTHPSIPKSV